MCLEAEPRREGPKGRRQVSNGWLAVSASSDGALAGSRRESVYRKAAMGRAADILMAEEEVVVGSYQKDGC